MALTEDEINNVFDNLDDQTAEVVMNLTKKWIGVKGELMAITNAWVELSNDFKDNKISADDLELRFSLFMFQTVVEGAMSLQDSDPTTLVILSVADEISDRRNQLVNDSMNQE